MQIFPSRIRKISKFLSYHLRHRPDKLGLELLPGGWIEVDKLLITMKKENFLLHWEELNTVVQQNDKQRFSFDSTRNLIRANQGHSVKIDLQLKSTMPPEILYHGTHKAALAQILCKGLKKMSRHHVHLSADWRTAQKVGARRGLPIVLRIDAKAMWAKGYSFYCSNNEVWLVDAVPKDYIKQSNK